MEGSLYDEWEGKPTTVLLRHKDSTIDGVTKQRYHTFLLANVPNWRIPTEEEEQNNVQDADSYYDSAVKWLSENTRDSKRFNLLLKENIGYGFRRNSYGIRRYGISVSILSIFLVAWSLSNFQSIATPEFPLLSYFAIAFSSILLIWWAFGVSSTWVRDAAMSFGIRLLSCCDILDSPNGFNSSHSP